MHVIIRIFWGEGGGHAVAQLLEVAGLILDGVIRIFH